jgi:hemerythrin superfamily protein
MHDAQRLPPEASTTGTGDALDRLERDHRLVEQLFARASLVHGEARLPIIGAIVAALSEHATLEEEVVYPAIAEVVAGGELLTERHRAEHDEMKRLLERVGRATSDGPELEADLRSLQLTVQAHVAVEEGELFPAYRATASPQDVGQLTKTADQARRKSPASVR